MTHYIGTILLSSITCTGLWGFLQFLIARHDRKKGATAELKASVDILKREIDIIRDEMREDRATRARMHILAFADEIMHGVLHGKESFDQVMTDIDDYQRYCTEHPGYKNSVAVHAIEVVSETYHQRLQKSDFLEWRKEQDDENIL